MLKRIFSEVMLALLFVSMLTLAFEIEPVKAEPKTWTVDDDGPANFHTIQEAINAANPGDTIYVYNGTYYENVVVNKTVSLIGENKSRTIIDGNHTGTVMNITVNSVNITGFTIQNSGGWSDGIYVSSNGNNISKNVIINTTRAGIFLKRSSNNYISENKIVDNAFVGIRLRDAATENIIANNNMSNNQDAVLLEESSANNAIIENYISHNVFGVETGWLSSNNLILGNNIATNDQYGMLIHSNNNIISQNVVFNNNWGVLIGSSNNSIVGNNITYNDEYGIWLKSCSDNNIFENCISYNMDGIYLEDSSSSKIRGNNITANGAGIWIADAVGCDIYRNKLVSNIFGISVHGDFTDSSVYKNDIKTNLEGINIVTEYFFNNTLYHNNFINNTQHVRFSEASPNFWDNGIEGNYWSNFTSDDLNQDGIGDTPYIIDIENIDNYPLMGLFSEFNATSEYHVQTISNSTISDFQFNGTAISFNVSGENGTAGFCRIHIPTALMNATYKVFVNGTEVSYTLLPVSNSTHSYLYFTYQHSTKIVTIKGSNGITLYTLNITSTDEGTTDPPPGNYTYLNGTTISVTAIPEKNYVFAHWILDGINVGSQNPIDVLMTSNHTLHAVFLELFELTIIANVGGTTDPPPGTYNHTSGTTVDVTAVPDIGYSFDHWLLDGELKTENPITILMDSNYTLEAYFIDNIKPDISDPWQDPSPNNVQPFQNVTVWVNVTDYGTGVKNATLWYSTNNGITWTTLNMTALPIPSDTTITYEATIPGYENCTWITYKIIAYDKAGNNQTKDNNGYGYKYHVIPEFPSAIILPLFIVISIIAVVFAKKTRYKKPKHSQSSPSFLRYSVSQSKM